MSHRVWTTLSLWIILATGVHARAGTLYVDASNPNCPGSGAPGDPFCTIQDAINAAVDGDTVLVAAGTYLENIDFLGKAISVVGSGAASTIIDGNQAGTVVTFQSGEGPGSVLEGFKITNGSGTDVNGIWKGGGILCLSSSPTIRSNDISGNGVGAAGCDNKGGDGGGIYAESSSLTIENNVIGNNKAGNSCAWGRGAGIRLEASSCRITGNKIQSNRTDGSSGDGGGISMADTSGLIQDNLIDGNTAVGGFAMGSGGGIGGGASASEGLTIVNNTISQNSSFFGGGAAVGPNTLFTRNWVDGNHGYYGGGIRAGDAEVFDNIIVNNSAVYGGGIDCGGSGGTVSHNLILHNSAKNVGESALGGGVFVSYRSSPTIANNTIVGNDAEDSGGGIACVGDATIWNNVIASNHANNGGGVFLSRYAVPEFTNNTIARNSALSLGGGIEMGDSQGTVQTVTNSIVWGNSPVQITADPTDVVQYCNVEGGWPGTGNINADPVFLDAAAGDYRIGCTSPCVDAGTSFVNLPPVDLEDNARIVNGLVDIGADELDFYWQLNGPAIAGGPPVDLTARAHAQLRGFSEVFISLGFGWKTGGIPVPRSGRRRIGLDPDNALLLWLSLPNVTRHVTLSGCAGATTASVSIPPAVPVGLQVYYAGVTWDAVGNVVAITATQRVTVQ